MVVGEVPEGVDLLVVGAGPGGYTAALRAAALGRDVTLVDADGEAGVGGVCLRTGCIPSKALIEVADAAHRARTWGEAGLRVDGASVDLAQFQRFSAGIVSRLGDGVRRRLAASGVRVMRGRFRFTRRDQAVIERDDGGPSTFVEFRDVVLATGSRPLELEHLPRDGRVVLDSTDVLALDTLPERVAIVGGGYIGVELGTALAKLGARVTIVEALDRLLPGMDASVAPAVRAGLEALGVEVLTGGRAGDYDGHGLKVGTRVVPCDVVVIAIGRRPNVETLALDVAGITPGAGGLLHVGPDRRAARHVAAIGDLTPGHALAHKATAEAEVAAEALCGRPAAFDPAAVPAVVFSDPEVAIAGLSASEARVAGMTVRVLAVPLAASGRAATLGARNGFVRLVVDEDADAVVGAQIVGPHASELIAEAVLAIEMTASPVDVAASIHPHPTLSELLSDAARR